MSVRPHTKEYLKPRRNYRCPKCGRMLAFRLVRCKSCGLAQPKQNLGKKKRKAKAFRRRKKVLAT